MILSRILMSLSRGVRIQQTREQCRAPAQVGSKAANHPVGAIIDKKMQPVLWFAGLRGAMSFALVEYIRLHESVSGEGTRVKPKLRAMTSARIMFIVVCVGRLNVLFDGVLGNGPQSNDRKQQQPSSLK
jgi:hypothetical protein